MCGGYGRDLIWVHASAPEPAKIEDAEAREASISPHIVPWRAHYAVSEGEGINIVLHDSLVRSARQTKYLGTFWSVYLPDGKEFSALARQRTPCGWTDTLGQLYDSEPTLQMAALAISTSVMGGESNDQQLRIKGMQTYSRALQEMSVALKDSKRWLGDGLLAAVRIMELYEVGRTHVLVCMTRLTVFRLYSAPIRKSISKPTGMLLDGEATTQVSSPLFSPAVLRASETGLGTSFLQMPGCKLYVDGAKVFISWC